MNTSSANRPVTLVIAKKLSFVINSRDPYISLKYKKLNLLIDNIPQNLLLKKIRKNLYRGLVELTIVVSSVVDLDKINSLIEKISLKKMQVVLPKLMTKKMKNILANVGEIVQNLLAIRLEICLDNFSIEEQKEKFIISFYCNDKNLYIDLDEILPLTNNELVFLLRNKVSFISSHELSYYALYQLDNYQERSQIIRTKEFPFALYIGENHQRNILRRRLDNKIKNLTKDGYFKLNKNLKNKYHLEVPTEISKDIEIC